MMSSKILKFSLISAFFLIVLVLTFIILGNESVAAGISQKTKQKVLTISAKEISIKKNKKIKATFVELGSIKCVPCKMMQPIMDEIIREYKGQVEVVFYDVWTLEGRPYAEKYKIRAIPTQVFLDEKGNEYYRHVGFFPKDELVKILYLKGVK